MISEVLIYSLVFAFAGLFALWGALRTVVRVRVQDAVRLAIETGDQWSDRAVGRFSLHDFVDAYRFNTGVLLPYAQAAELLSEHVKEDRLLWDGTDIAQWGWDKSIYCVTGRWAYLKRPYPFDPQQVQEK